MAEAREPEAAEEAEPAFDTGAAAIALALDEARDHPAKADEVSAFLAAQRSLVELQKHHLHAQFQQLRLRTAGEGIKLALQGLTLAAVLGVVVILGVMVRDASRARGLVVEGFHAPPAFAARGYSGEVLGAALTGRLGEVQRFANANSLTNSEEVRAGGAPAAAARSSRRRASPLSCSRPATSACRTRRRAISGLRKTVSASRRP